MRCEKCGEEIVGNMRFCGFCGEELTYEVSEEMIEALENELHQVFYKGKFSGDDSDIILNKLDYDMENNTINLTDADGKILFSAECDRPVVTRSNEGEVIFKKTFYYNPKLKNYLILKNKLWRIYDVETQEVCLIDGLEGSNKIPAEFEEVEIGVEEITAEFKMVIKCMHNNKYGLVKLCWDAYRHHQIRLLADFVYIEMRKYKSVNSSGFYSDNYEVWYGITDNDDVIIHKEFGMLFSLGEMEIYEGFEYYEETHANIIFIFSNGKYETYSKNDIRINLNNKISYSHLNIKPIRSLSVGSSLLRLGNAIRTFSSDQDYKCRKVGAVENGEVLFDAVFDDIEPIHEELNNIFIVCQSGYYGVLSSQNHTVVPIRFTNLKVSKVSHIEEEQTDESAFGSPISTEVVILASHFEKEYLIRFKIKRDVTYFQGQISVTYSLKE